MFAVDHVLISEDVAEAQFSCNLGACLGACCVHGDSGAPLEPDERAALEQALPVVRDRLRPEARRVIDARGVWEETGAEQYATTCVDDAECVFVTYEGRVAKCAIQQAYQEGRVAFEKPLSCHLFPVRVAVYGDLEVMNYEPAPSLCDPAVKQGRREGLWLSDLLRRPLERRYGAAWYDRFRAACAERRALRHEAAAR